MTYFSQLLDAAIEESGLSVVYLAEMSGINRTYISKLRNGTRMLHNEEKMLQLIKALRCSSEQEELLLKEYRIAAFGRERYDTMQAVKSLIEGLSQLPSLPGARPIPMDGHELPGALYGKGDVNHALRAIIAREAALEEGHIRIIAQHDFWDLARMLPNSCYKNGNLTVEHIVCLHSAATPGANLYNLNCLEQFIPVLICGCKYNLMYHYGEQSINSMSIFPYYLSTSAYAVSISHNGDLAIIHTDPGQITAMNGVFNTIKTGCSSVITTLSMEGRLEMYNRWYNQRGQRDITVRTLSNRPALAPYVDMEIAARVITDAGKTQLPAIEGLLKLFKMDFATSIVKYFSMDGLRGFLSEGRIPGIPDALYNPLPMEDRLELVKRWRERCNADDFTNMAIQHGRINVPENVYIEALNMDDIVLSYTHPSGGEDYCVVLEKSIANSIYEYLIFLETGGNVHSEKETLAMVDACVAEA